MKKQHTLGITTLIILVLVGGLLSWLAPQSPVAVENVPTLVQESEVTPAPETLAPFVPTEQFAGQIDRVSVQFAHQDYTTYELTTNGVMRSGPLNTERGFGDDADATVYVLNWQSDPTEHILYVRLSREPDSLYLLDSNRAMVTGSVLTRMQQ